MLMPGVGVAGIGVAVAVSVGVGVWVGVAVGGPIVGRGVLVGGKVGVWEGVGGTTATTATVGKTVWATAGRQALRSRSPPTSHLYKAVKDLIA